MNSVRNFFGLGDTTTMEAAPVVAVPTTTRMMPITRRLGTMSALRPVGTTTAMIAPTTTRSALASLIGGAKRSGRKNLKKKYKMPGRRSTRRANRKTSRKNRKASRKNRKASRKH